MLAVIYAKYFAYVAVRKLYGLIQGLYWLINGTYLSLYLSRRPGNYYRAAHLLDIRARYKLDLLLEPSGPANFISTHNGFVCPTYVLQDNVTLYYITATEAVFVESDEDIDVAHSENGSFIRAAQFERARRIVIIPIDAFHKLAEEVGDPKGELIFVTNTARCGSTLLNQIFEETEVCIGFSEPDALNAIATYKDKLPQEELDMLIRNCIRMQCKPFRNRRIDAFILKPTAPTIDAVPMFVRIYPDAHQLFMYREGIKVAQSLIRISTQTPLFALALVLTKISPRLSEMSFEAMGLPSKDFKIKLPSPITFCVFVWAMICNKYRGLREQGFKISGVKYEDLIERPMEATKAVLKYCNLPDELADKAMRAFNKDSQKNSILSMKNLPSKSKSPGLEGEDKVIADSICDKLKQPRIPEPCNLEGTITAGTSTIETNGATQ